MVKICYYVGMSNNEHQNTKNNHETAERLTDPVIQAEVADTAIGAEMAGPTADELALKQQAEALVAELSYEGQAFESPAAIMKRTKNPRAVRGFIQSRRSDPNMGAIYHLADEVWLRNSNSASNKSARSYEYLETLINACQNPELPETPDEVTDMAAESDETTTPPEADQPSGNTKPVIVVVDATPSAQTGASSGNQPTPAAPAAPTETTPPAPSTPRKSPAPKSQPGVRLTPVDKSDNSETETSAEVSVDKVAGWKADLLRINEELQKLNREISLAQNDPRVKADDPLTAQRQTQVAGLKAQRTQLLANIKAANLTPALTAQADKKANDLAAKAQEKATEQAAKDATDRQAKIDSFLTLPPSARQQRKQKRSDALAQLRSDRKLMHDRLENNGMSDELKKVADLLAKHNRKIGGGRLSALSHMAWKVENKWRNHPIHAEEGLDLDAKEQRRDLDEILFAEDGMLVKMFTANNIAYDNFTPKELYDVLFAADAKNVLRSSRVASMGRVSCLASGLVNVGDALAGSANAGLNLAIILPRAGQPLYNREINRRYAAIAHLDKAAAKAAAKRSQSSSAA